MNKAILIGRITKEAEMRSTTGGVNVTSFDLAVKQKYKNSDGEYGTDFIRCTVFRNGADYICGYAHKGDLISVEGYLKNSSWEKDGEKRYRTEVVCESVKILASKKEEAVQLPEEFGADISDDDLPY